MPLFSFFSRVRSDKELALQRPKNVARVFAAVVMLGTLVLLTAPPFQMRQVRFEPGRPVARTVDAPFAFDVEDKDASNEELAKALAHAPKIYAYDPEVPNEILKNLQAIVRLTERFERENENRPRPLVDYGKLARAILDEVHLDFSTPTLRTLSPEIRAAHFVKSLGELFQQLCRDTVIVRPSYADDYETPGVAIKPPPAGPLPPSEALQPRKTLVYPGDVRAKLRATYLPRFYPLAGTDNQRAAWEALNELALALARPNLVYQEDLTNAERDRRVASIKPVYRHYRRGMQIVRAGQIPADPQRRALTEYNLRVRTYRLLQFAAYLFIAVGMFVYLGLYARRFRPLLRFRTSSIVLIGLPLLLVLFVGRVATLLLGDRYPDIGYLFPAPLLGMLGVILLDTEIAVFLVLIGSVLIGLATNMSYQYMMAALFGGLAAVGSVYRLRQRGQLFRAASYVALANILAIAVFRFVEDPTQLVEDPTQLLYQAGAWGVLNAVVCYLLATGMVPLLESVFGITTDLKLLELTGGHHPLLRELEEKAPGSYQHSLNVAKLAEAAADAIGANYLLVRAGACFHDIGKTLKPRYFSENQLTPEERRTHEKLTPFMSCLIIRNHVKEGLELARNYGVPEKVIDFIPQHHGTCLIKYFYYEAVRQYEESESAEPVRQADFRYPGPKPQSIEAAIVMLADSVEAIATNRLTRPNVDADDIRKLVNDAIQDKFSDGQFDECHLTLRQLHDIRESMVRTLLGRFHHRVDYPKAPASTTKRAVREAAAA